MSNCKGNHALVEVLRVGYNDDMQKSVKWCATCGAVVVDGEFDGRTYPGKYLAMRLPTAAISAAGDPK